MPYQDGFRKDRNCLEHIHVLRKVMGAYYQGKLPLIAVFINFQKVFDSIYREMIWMILRNYGIPKKIVIASEVIYSCSKSTRLGLPDLDFADDIVSFHSNETTTG